MGSNNGSISNSSRRRLHLIKEVVVAEGHSSLSCNMECHYSEPLYFTMRGGYGYGYVACFKQALCCFWGLDLREVSDLAIK